MKKILCMICAVSTAMSVFATAPDKKDSSLEFNPHLFLTVQGGVSYNLHDHHAEATFKEALSGAAAIYVGYQFLPWLGARAGFSGWESKGSVVKQYLSFDPNRSNVYRYNFVQGNVDAVFDLASAIAGFRHNRVVNPYVFAGVGLNGAFNNGEAKELADLINQKFPEHGKNTELEKLWTGSHLDIGLRVGLGVDFNLCDYVLFGIEVNGNALDDSYDSRKHKNFDWQFNALASLKFRLAKNYRSNGNTSVYAPVATPVTTAPAEEAPVQEETAPVAAEPTAVAPMAGEPTPVQLPAQEAVKETRTDVFFVINSSTPSAVEAAKIEELAKYLNEHPNAKVEVTGYADAETGTHEINMRISKQRAENVAAALKKAGVAAERITAEGKGDTVQPFGPNNIQNRAVICITE